MSKLILQINGTGDALAATELCLEMVRKMKRSGLKVSKAGLTIGSKVNDLLVDPENRKKLKA